MAKCLHLPYIQECLDEFNVKLKKVQHISNYKWKYEVKPMLDPLVM